MTTGRRSENQLCWWNDEIIHILNMVRVEEICFKIRTEKVTLFKKLLLALGLHKPSRVWVIEGNVWGSEPDYIERCVIRSFRERFPELSVYSTITNFANLGITKMGHINFEFTFDSDADEALFILSASDIIEDLKKELTCMTI